MSGNVQTVNEATALERLAIFRLQARFFGTPVAVWNQEQEGFLTLPDLPADPLPGESPQLELSETVIGPVYRATWRQLAWPDRFTVRALVMTHVPSYRCVFYRRGSARWHLPPPRGTVLSVAGRHRPFAVEVDRAGICHRPGSWIGCKARILWTITASGGKLPLNWQPRVDGKFVPHWATCPHARHFRKRPR